MPLLDRITPIKSEESINIFHKPKINFYLEASILGAMQIIEAEQKRLRSFRNGMHILAPDESIEI